LNRAIRCGAMIDVRIVVRTGRIHERYPLPRYPLRRPIGDLT
jgi:hypothetical protein